MALLSGIALTLELLGRYGGCLKDHDPVSVLRLRTSGARASPLSPASHTLDPLAPCYYTFPD